METGSSELNEGAKKEGGIRIPFMFPVLETNWMEVSLEVSGEKDKTDVGIDRRTERIRRENRSVIAYTTRH